MLPARDRITVLKVYDTEANMLADTSGTSYTEGFVDESCRLEHTFYDRLPGFGAFNAAMFECDMNISADMTGKWIRVITQAFATDAATTRTDYKMFAGLVDSCHKDSYTNLRHLVAYDKAYELRKLDISDWWNTYWQTASDTTIGNLVTAACTQFGVAVSSSFTLRNTFTVKASSQKAHKLSGCSFAQFLKYVGQICAIGFYMTEDGKLDTFISARDVTPVVALDGYVDTKNSTFGDDVGQQYGNFMVYEGADIVYSNGSSTPTYAIRDNVLCMGFSTADLATLFQNHLGYAQQSSYITSADIELIVSHPDEFLSSKPVTYDSVKHLVNGVVFYGRQLINSTLYCTSELGEDSTYSGNSIDMANQLTEMGVEMTFKVNADSVIEAVNLEAQGGVTINAEALNINGVVSANDGFKVNLDGSMAATAGVIGGWTIAADGLYKEYDISDNEKKRIRLVSDETQGVKVIVERGSKSNNIWYWTDMGTFEDGYLYLNAFAHSSSTNDQIEMYGNGVGRDQYYGLGYLGSQFWDNMMVQDRYFGELSSRKFHLENTQQDVPMMSMLAHKSELEAKPDSFKMTYADTKTTKEYPYQDEASIEINPHYPQTAEHYYPYIILDDKEHQSATRQLNRHIFIDSIGMAGNYTALENGSSVSSSGLNLTVGGVQFTSSNSNNNVSFRSHYQAGVVRMYDGAGSYASNERVHIERGLIVDGRYFASNNLIDIKTIVQGYVNADGTDGTDSSIASSYVKTGYIKAASSTTYSFSVNLSQYGLHVFEYDSSKSFLRYASIGQGLTTNVSFSTGANTAYIRVQINNFYSGSVQWTYPSDITSCQVERGSLSLTRNSFVFDGVEVARRIRSINAEDTHAEDITINGDVYLNRHRNLGYSTSIAAGTYSPSGHTSQITFAQFVNDCMATGGAKFGSVYLAGESSTVVVTAGWYHFEYIPHRSGKVFGSSDIDSNLRAVVKLYALHPHTNRETYEFRIVTTDNSTWHVDTYYRNLEGAGNYSPDPSTCEFTMVYTRIHRGQADLYGKIELKQAVGSFYVVHPDVAKAVGVGMSFPLVRTADGNIYPEDGVINVSDTGQLRLIGRNLSSLQPHTWVFEAHYQINPSDTRYVYTV